MDGEIFRILEQERKPQPILGKTWPKNSFSLAALMGIVVRASFGTSGPPPYGLSEEALRVGNFRVLAGSITKLDEDTVMFQITNGREDLYVKITRNTAVEAWSSNIRTALKQIIETLSRREYQAISEDAFQVFKFDNYTTVVGTNLEAVHALTITG
jgi:hypothetical protein